MKILYGITLFLFVSFAVQAQHNYDNQSVIYSNNGNVGIGTSNPSAKLHVNGAFDFLTGVERLHWGSQHIGQTSHRNYLAPRKADDSGWDWNQEFGYQNYYRAWYFDGNVGIGTDNPSAKLHVNGSFDFLTGAERLHWGSQHVGQTGHRNYLTPRKADDSDWDWDQEFGYQNYYRAWYFNGNVGIGTDNPSHKLAVNGTIRAKEIIVNTGWSDFVFEKDYNLPTLQEVEHYIAENGHLRDIPSAKEVEENGVKLGEMDSRLLQKIEELTLYVIAMDKKVKVLEEENKVLKAHLK